MKKLNLSMCLLASLLLLLSSCAAKRVPDDPAEVLHVSGQQDIYFATGNDYYDLYVGHSWIPGPEITLLSRAYIDPDSISVSADIEAAYTVHVTEQETGASLTSYEILERDGTREVTATAMNADDFPLYLYQTYAGMDWAKVGALYAEYYAMMELHEAGNADADQVKAALSAYNDAATEYVTEYAKLTVEDLPTYYEYLIQIMIDHAETEETLTTIQVTIGDTVYDVDVGEIRIRPNSGYSSGSEYLSMAMGSPYWLISYPYGEGIEQCRSETYYAEAPLTLTGLRFLENTMSAVEVLDTTVVLSDETNGAYEGAGIEIQWDGITPIYVEQGKYVTLVLTVQDERMKEINYHSNVYPVLEFEHDGADYENISEIPLYRYYSDKWLLYAIGLDGIDMERYFNDYYYAAVSNWRGTEA